MSSEQSSVQKSDINTVFNTSMLDSLLLGTYTVIYLGTLFLYASKKSNKNWFIIGSTSLSYLAYTTATAVQWYQSKISFVDNSTSQENIYLSTLVNPSWEILVNDICTFLTAALADGLLIWRCFHVWGQSYRAVLPACFLLFCEIAIDLTVIVFAPAVHFQPSEQQIKVLDDLISTSLFITCVTTILTTILIAYQIHSATRHDVLQGSKARFKHVLEILVQSAATYSLATLPYAISLVIPPSINPAQVLSLEEYSATFFIFVAGIAPTIMVARVAIVKDTSTEFSGRSHISGLRFQSATPRTTQPGTESRDSHLQPESDAVKASEKVTLHIA